MLHAPSARAGTQHAGLLAEQQREGQSLRAEKSSMLRQDED